MKIRLREVLARDEVILAPAAYDVVSAQIIERAGYPVCWISGLGHEASDLGCPDLSLTSSVEMIRRAATVVQSVDVPVVCDADTGFGGAINVTRTVRLFEAAGVGAIHLEDQTFPKRCGALPGKQVIPREAFARRLDVAARARKSRDFTIIARTDAKALGIDEVISRLQTYVEHGADLGMLGDFYSLDEYRKITAAVRAPIVACAADADHRAVQDNFSAEEWKQAGVKMVVYWYLPLFAAMKAVERAVSALRSQGTTASVELDLSTYEEYGRVVKLRDWMEIEKRAEDAG
jgi:2-methylisocitrate lyase-like PEP mutase family enzyme